MYDSDFAGMTVLQVIAIMAAAILALWMIYWFLFRQQPEAPALVAPGEGNVRNPQESFVDIKPRPLTKNVADLEQEVRTLRGQIDAEVLARLAAEGKLKDAAAGSAPLLAEIDGLKRSTNDLTLQNNDLLKRLDAQQEDQMRVAARANEEIALLKRQLEQTPAAGVLDGLRAEAEGLKRANNDLALQNNDLLKRLDRQQEDQMRVVAGLNEQITALKQQLSHTPGASVLETLRAEAETFKRNAADLTLQNNDLLKRLDKQQEDQMRVVAGLNEQLAALQTKAADFERQLSGATIEKNDLMNGVNRLVWDYIGPPAAHLQGRETADDQFGKLRNHLRNSQHGGAEVQARISHLQNELTNATKRVGELDSDIVRLKAQIAQAPADLSSEVRRLSEQLTVLSRERDEARATERNLVDRVRVAEHDLSQARSGMEELGRLSAERQDEVQRLKIQLASMPNVDEYKRFKDALEAANRIASGQKA